MNAEHRMVAVTNSASTSWAATIVHASVVTLLKTAKPVKVSFDGLLSLLQWMLSDV